MSARILFVDDDTQVLRSIERTFRGFSYEVLTCSRADDALKKISEWEPDLIFSDYSMPSIDGLTLLQLASEKAPDSARILMTGFADVRVLQEAINAARIDLLLTKPWNPEELLAAAQSALNDLEERRSEEWKTAAEKKCNVELRQVNTNLAQQLNSLQAELGARERALRVHYGETIRILLAALEVRTPGATQKAYARAQIVKVLTEVLGESWICEMALTAALLQDIGNLAHRQPESTSDDNWHCSLGAKMLQGSMFCGIVTAAVEAHHENWDGSGPAKLRGLHIPFLARCLRFADLVSEYIANYKEMPAEALITFLDHHNGRTIDPNLASQAINLVKKQGVRALRPTSSTSSLPELFRFEVPLTQV